jgi:hypothetical protein
MFQPNKPQSKTPVLTSEDTFVAGLRDLIRLHRAWSKPPRMQFMIDALLREAQALRVSK